MNSIQPGYKTILAISRELMNQFVENLLVGHCVSGEKRCFISETPIVEN